MISMGRLLTPSPSCRLLTRVLENEICCSVAIIRQWVMPELAGTGFVTGDLTGRGGVPTPQREPRRPATLAPRRRGRACPARGVGHGPGGGLTLECLGHPTG